MAKRQDIPQVFKICKHCKAFKDNKCYYCYKQSSGENDTCSAWNPDRNHLYEIIVTLYNMLND